MNAVRLPFMESLDPSLRWGVEFRSLDGRWLEVFTLGTESLANRMLVRICGTVGGDWRIRRPGRAA